MALAINGLVSFSKLPLRLSTYVGLFAAFVSLLMACLVLYWRIVYPNSPLTGLATIMYDGDFLFGGSTIGKYWNFGGIYRTYL